MKQVFVSKTGGAYRGLFLVVLLLLPIAGAGQAIRGGAGFFYGGIGIWPGAATAIQQLSKLAESPGNDQYRMLGAEIYGRRNRWLFGAGASAFINKRVQDAPTQTVIESSASNAHIWIGWIAWHTKRTKLYPIVGPGINSFNVNSTLPGGVPTTYVLDGLATDIGLTIDWLVLKTGSDPNLYAGPMLSIRAGYRLSTASNEWHGDRNGATIVSPVRYSPQGFFLTLGIGGGGFRHP
ncbi:hypothetical protein GO730_20440 [Spirosoma sp. HMF3257]|uniref:Outer membrane beta-barrel protein n=1 Tax=Spirosoma telluris TaxID=2183553 RepID=A0A327NMA6_9BACT|nr:hypothetical protein [Spirosoma telluris]RAI75933.1 hypothetical protein HMF3257_20360 [Spirosoma telluris]